MRGYVVLELDHYRIRTIEEATAGGYRRDPDFFVPDAGVLFDMVASMEDKLEELAKLSPHQRGMNLPVLRKYSRILRGAFIIVQEEFGYCFWYRDITRNN